MRVLVACEYSGTVRDAFTHDGHYAVSNDILPTESPGEHIQGDALDAIKSFKPDLLIAHPPCTFLSRSSAKHLKTEPCRWAKALMGQKFFYALLNQKVKYICIENPRPHPRMKLPQASQRIQPHYFGDPFTKETFLWLRNLPPLMATVMNPNRISWTEYADKGNGRGEQRRKARAKFFPGIANAFSEQWGNL